MYNIVKDKIISTLLGRPEGEEVKASNHQDYALNLLEYVRKVEISSQSVLIGIAEENTEPLQPASSKVSYLAGISLGDIVTFSNFLDENEEPITIDATTASLFAILIWNGAYWSSYAFETSLILNEIDFLENTDQSLLYIKKNLTKIGISGVLFCSGVPNLITSTTETSLFVSTGFSPNSNKIIKANDLRIGSAIRIKMTGIFSTLSGATANLKIKVGNTLIKEIVEIFDNNRVDYYFEKEITLACRTVGQSGSVICQGRSLVQDGIGGQTALIPLAITAPIVINTEIDNNIDMTFKWNSSGNSITVSTATIEILS